MTGRTSDHPRDLSDFKRVELVWPGKDITHGVAQHEDGRWLSLRRDGTRRRYPLLETSRYPPDTANPRSAIVAGDRIRAMATLQRAVGRRVKLAYLDAPRLDVDDETTAFRANSPQVLSTWMSTLRAHLQVAKPLMARDGFVVIQAGDLEQPYARLIGDELFRGGHVATIVWQRAYAPRNMRGMKEFTTTHDYLIVFAFDKESLTAVGMRAPPEGFLNPDDDPRGAWKAEHKGAATRRESTDFDTYVAPYRWRVVEGSLPPGIWRINPLTGIIWGKPLEPGVFPFNVEVKDSTGKTAIKGLSITVSETGESPAYPDIPWFFEEIRTSGSLRVASRILPSGVVGEAYSAVCLGAGGKPHLGAPKRPGSGRYWEFANYTLRTALQQDAVDFGKSGTAIPKIKRYQQDVGDTVVTNQVTWWPGRVEGRKSETFAGYTQDATKHLKALKELGDITETVSTTKPDHLLARLIDIFSLEQDYCLEVFGGSADLASVAMKRNRRFIYLAGGSERDRRLLENLAIPRLTAVAKGHDHNITERGGALREGSYLPHSGGGDYLVLEVGEWVVERRPGEQYASVNTPDYPDESLLRAALLSSEGFVTGGMAEPLSHTLQGDAIAFVLKPDEFLTPEVVSQLASEAERDKRPLTVYYFRASPDLKRAVSSSTVAFKRVPFDMGV